MKLIYIAHPLAASTPEAVAANVDAYLRIAAWATRSPVEMGHGAAVASWVHHYLLHSRGLTALPGEEYLRRDAELIRRCDELWYSGDSVGVRFEREVARACGLPIYSIHPVLATLSRDGEDLPAFCLRLERSASTPQDAAILVALGLAKAAYAVKP